MASNFTAPISFRHEDPSVERQFRNLDERVKELVKRPAMSGEVLLDVELPNGTQVLIPHGQGRPVSVFPSGIRGASSSGRIEESRDTTNDRSQYIVLEAKGFGATITVDLWVL